MNNLSYDLNCRRAFQWDFPKLLFSKRFPFRIRINFHNIFNLIKLSQRIHSLLKRKGEGKKPYKVLFLYLNKKLDKQRSVYYFKRRLSEPGIQNVGILKPDISSSQNKNIVLVKHFGINSLKICLFSP